MDIQALITQVGFPIAMCVWFIYDKNKTFKEMTDAMTATIALNTKVMSAFIEHFNLKSVVEADTIAEIKAGE